MSRIVTERVKDGEVIAAADLNTRFTDYTQTTLNAFNVRDAGVDLPAFSDTDFMVPFVQSDNIGKNDLFATAPVTVTGIGALPSAGYVVNDGAGVPVDTIATFVGGLAVTADDVLRVYWHLNVNPIWNTVASTPPWYEPGTIDTYSLPFSGASPYADIPTSATVWVMYLQWDITSAALVNWVEPDYQNPFTTPVGATGLQGNLLATCAATSTAPCWCTYSNADNRVVLANTAEAFLPNWRVLAGSYYYTPAAGTTTVYGMRLVIKGPMHPYNTGGANYLVHTLNVMNGTNVQLEYTGGTISTIKQRLS